MKSTPVILTLAMASLISACTGASRTESWANPYPRAEAPGAYTDSPQEIANKRLAIEYFDAVYNAKDAVSAARLAAPELNIHEPGIADGTAGLDALVGTLKREHPSSRSEIKRIVTDGDQVFLHAHTVHSPGTVGFISGNILRIQNGRIVDHVNILHPIPYPPHKDNHNTAFCAGEVIDCPSTVRTKADEARNKKLAYEFYSAALNEKDWPKASRYIGPRYTQHSLYMQDGPSGIEELSNKLRVEHPANRGELKRELADGDLVVMQMHVTRNRQHLGWSVIEILRFENGKVIEHWDMFRVVPEKEGDKLF
jgi:predicted SnoaL-like aldol condensation-catalyzing enzyme